MRRRRCATWLVRHEIERWSASAVESKLWRSKSTDRLLLSGASSSMGLAFLGRGRPNPLALWFWRAWPAIAISGKPRLFLDAREWARVSLFLLSTTSRCSPPFGLNYTVPTNPRQTSTGQADPRTPCSGGPSTSSRCRRSGRRLRRPLLARSGAARPNSDSGSAVASAAAARRRRSRGRLSRPSRARRPSRRCVWHALVYVYVCI